MVDRLINNKFLGIATCLIVVATLSGCASGGEYRSDYDHTVDFGQYTTYNFYEGAGPESTEYQSFFSKYMVKAITKEMELRGYVLSDNPDLLANFNAVLEDKTKVTTSSAPMTSSYYGYRGGFYDPWGPSYGYSQQTHVSQYTEGTFNIDLVDAKRKKLVWEAVGVGRVTAEDLTRLEEGVATGVPKFFAFYPFVAGDGTPRETE